MRALRVARSLACVLPAVLLLVVSSASAAAPEPSRLAGPPRPMLEASPTEWNPKSFELDVGGGVSWLACAQREACGGPPGVAGTVTFWTRALPWFSWGGSLGGLWRNEQAEANVRAQRNWAALTHVSARLHLLGQGRSDLSAALGAGLGWFQQRAASSAEQSPRKVNTLSSAVHITLAYHYRVTPWFALGPDARFEYWLRDPRCNARLAGCGGAFIAAPKVAWSIQATLSFAFGSPL